MPKKDKLNPDEIKTRDPLLQALICGATKGGIHKDRKKDANKRKCRKKVDRVQDE